MNKKIVNWAGGLLALAVLVYGAASVKSAYAQADTTNPVAAALDHGRGGGHGGERGLGTPELEAAAEVLGMTADELSAALSEGKTLEDLATEANVDIQDVQDAISAVHADEIRARIEAAVADGTMTQEKADWLLEGLDKGFLDGPGFGIDGPRGGHGGMHGDLRPQTETAPAATAVP